MNKDEFDKEIPDFQCMYYGACRKNCENCQDYDKKTYFFYYDTDSSPIVWEHYRNKYGDLLTEYKINAKNEKGGLEPSGYRLLAPCEYNESSPFVVQFGGDCDFNFNWKKYNNFKNIILKDGTRLDLIAKLNELHAAHSTLKNFSLMPATGGMNNFKGKGNDDRLDTFVYVLNEHFLGKTTKIIDYAKGMYRGWKGMTDDEKNTQKEIYGKHLSNYLGKFVIDDDRENAIYQYCEKIYFIKINLDNPDDEGKKLVDDLIKNGKEPITDINILAKHMELAEKFWEMKKSAWGKP
jgi:hypothetical protein